MENKIINKVENETKNKANLFNLPNDVIIIIFSYVGYRFYPNIISVCKHFKELMEKKEKQYFDNLVLIDDDIDYVVWSCLKKQNIKFNNYLSYSKYVNENITENENGLDNILKLFATMCKDNKSQILEGNYRQYDFLKLIYNYEIKPNPFYFYFDFFLFFYAAENNDNSLLDISKNLEKIIDRCFKIENLSDRIFVNILKIIGKYDIYKNHKALYGITNEILIFPLINKKENTKMLNLIYDQCFDEKNYDNTRTWGIIELALQAKEPICFEKLKLMSSEGKNILPRYQDLINKYNDLVAKE